MKMKKGSRIIALLLSLVMLLGTMSTALAAESNVIVENGLYDDLLTAAVAGYYDELMACETLEEMSDIADRIVTEQGYVFLDALTEEQLTQFNARVDELYADFLVRTTYPKLHAYTNVAPFLEPVTGEEAAPIAMFSLNANTRAASDSGTDNGIELRKGVSDTPNADGEYILTLEAWVTGTRVVTEVKEDVPTDIILVLDQSGSMSNNINGYTETYSINTENAYYVLNSSNEYIAVEYCSTCQGWVNSTQNHWNNRHENLTVYQYKTSTTDTTAGRVQFYNATSQTKLNALKTAVNTFINSVSTKALGPDGRANTADDVKHRVAIVGFASTGSTRSDYKNTELLSTANVVNYRSASNSNYSDALVSANGTNGQVNTRLTTAVNRLEASGDTYLEYGMDMANKVFAQYPIDTTADPNGRNRVVVVFTDGYPAPSGTNNFNYDMANNAISNAYDTKHTYGATVYTVAVLEDADPSASITSGFQNGGTSSAQQTVASNRYMHYVSSNYPDATSLTNGGTISSAVDPFNDGVSFYLSASDSATLNGIFKQISDNVESGSQTGTLTEESITMDVIAPSFTLPAGVTADDPSKIKVYTAAYTGKNTTGEYTFSSTWNTLGTTPQVDGAKIKVDGFDFAENWVGTNTENNTTTNHGAELIIQIPIVVRPDFLGGNNVPTNSEGSGIYVDDEAETPVEEFVSPKLDIKVKEIVPKLEDQHIYLSNNPDLKAMLGRTDNLLSYTVNGNPYKVDGVNNAYVDITYTFYALDANGNRITDKDNNAVVAQYVVKKGQKVIDAASTVENYDNFPVFTKDTKFEISCKVDAGEGNESSSTGEAMLYVYNPVLTFKDTEERYKADNTAGESVTTDDAYYAAKNYQSAETYWYNSGLDKKINEQNATLMNGDAPSIQVNYADNGKTLLNNSKTVDSTECIPVNVSVQLDGSSTADNVYVDYTDKSYTIRKACDCEHGKLHTACVHTNATGVRALAANNDPEFIVHVFDTTVELILEKTVHKSDLGILEKTFFFKVEVKNPETDKYESAKYANGTAVSSIQVTVDANGVKKTSDPIELLYVEGGIYRITEMHLEGAQYITTMQAVVSNGTEVSSVTDTSLDVTIPAGGSATVSVVNTATGSYTSIPVKKVWEDGENAWNTRAQNVTVYLNGGSAITLNASNNWASAWSNVPMYDANGNKITYSVTEDKIAYYNNPSYSGDVTKGFTVTNTLPVGNLEITKTGLETGDSAIFTVNIKRGNNVARTYQVVLTANSKLSETIKGIPAGYTYEVVEDPNWITRYTYDTTSTGMTGTIVANGTQNAAVKNKTNPGQWLDDESATENVFEYASDVAKN